MAPTRPGGVRRSTQASEHIYKLGERGRKTGVVLHDTGVRDEHGMEPIDDIFSSPTRSRAGDDTDEEDEEDEEEEDEEEDNEEEDEEDEDDSGEADMDLTTGSGLDPAALINGQRSAARFGARQQQQQHQSPAKSLFGSPAVRGSASKAAMRQKPLLRPPSSPENLPPQDTSSPSKPVKRRLDFGKNGSANAQRRPFGLAASNGTALKPRLSLQPRNEEYEEEDDQEEEEEEEAEEDHRYQNGDYDNDESMNMVGGGHDYDQSEEPIEEQESEPEPEPEPIPKRKAGRPPSKAKLAAVAAAAAPPAPAPAPVPAPTRKLPPGPLQYSSPVVASKTKRGRPPRNSGASDNMPEDQEQGQEQQNTKRQRVAEPPQPKRKAGRPPAAKRAAAEEPEPQQDEPAEEAPPKKKAGRKRKSSGVGAATAAVAAVPRGPPLPKSRGLVVRRRELAEDSSSIVRTRSGRNSFRPLAFWRNEHVELDPTDVQRDTLIARTNPGPRSFLLPSVREIVRVDEEELAPARYRSARGNGGGAKRGPKPKRRRGDDVGEDGDDADDALQRDPWETEVGKVSGDIVVWEPEHELEPPAPGQDVDLMSAEIALSSAAIQTNEVRGSSFRFAKTLSLPFFGTGMVDMPPGSEKKHKNARKMHMTFFVHYGLVSVKVNDTEFRIGKGGMWSVPRGNYYSIRNETDHQARLFFAQGCEILTALEDEDQPE